MAKGTPIFIILILVNISPILKWSLNIYQVTRIKEYWNGNPWGLMERLDFSVHFIVIVLI